MIVFNTNIISSLAKINRIDIVRRIFENETFVLPLAVYKELTVAKQKGYSFVEKIDEIVVFDEKDICEKKWLIVKPLLSEIKKVAKGLRKLHFRLDWAEAESIVLSKSINGVLLIDDREAFAAARRLKVEAFTLPGVIAYAKERKILTTKEIEEIISELETKDRYEFEKSVKSKLVG